MELFPKALAALAVQALILGAVLGALYSLLRVLRIMAGNVDPGSLPAFWNPGRLPFYGVVMGGRREHSLRFSRILTVLLTFLFDIVFCLTVAVGIFLLAYVGNQGRIRWFIPLGVMVGFLLFEVTLGRLLRRCSELLSAVLHLLWDCFFFLVSFPIRFCVKGIRHIYLRIYTSIRKRLYSRRLTRYTDREIRRLLDAASNGFGYSPFEPL